MSSDENGQYSNIIAARSAKALITGRPSAMVKAPAAPDLFWMDRSEN
jgi:hypothetical protein